MSELSQWDGLRYFRPASTIDNWGDPKKMDRRILLEIDNMRNYLGQPLIVTSGYRHGKSERGSFSYHEYGLAVDIVAPEFKQHLMDLFLIASRFNFKGIGVYRDWHYKGQSIGGLHLDMRSEVTRKQWLCYKDGAGVQQYIGLTMDALREYRIV